MVAQLDCETIYKKLIGWFVPSWSLGANERARNRLLTCCETEGGATRRRLFPRFPSLVNDSKEDSKQDNARALGANNRKTNMDTMWPCCLKEKE